MKPVNDQESLLKLDKYNDWIEGLDPSSVPKETTLTLRYLDNEVSLPIPTALDDDKWIRNSLVKAQKKPVSLHSTLSVMAMGAFICSVVPVFSPGYNEILHIPQVFALTRPVDESILQAQLFASWALTITGILGLFRMPSKIPKSRMIFFIYCATVNLSNTFVMSSNLLGTTYYLVDGFDMPWKFLLPAVSILSLAVPLWGLYDAIEGDMEGRDTVTGLEHRLQSVLLYAGLPLTQSATILDSLFPLYSDKTTYEEVFVPFIRDFGLDGANVMSVTLTVAAVSLGALIATLQLERKLTVNQAKMAIVALIFVFFFDAALISLSVALDPQTYLALNEEGAKYVYGALETTHVVGGTLVVTVLTAHYALWKSRVANANEVIEIGE